MNDLTSASESVSPISRPTALSSSAVGTATAGAGPGVVGAGGAAMGLFSAAKEGAASAGIAGASASAALRWISVTNVPYWPAERRPFSCSYATDARSDRCAATRRGKPYFSLGFHAFLGHFAFASNSPSHVRMSGAAASIEGSCPTAPTSTAVTSAPRACIARAAASASSGTTSSSFEPK